MSLYTAEGHTFADKQMYEDFKAAAAAVKADPALKYPVTITSSLRTEAKNKEAVSKWDSSATNFKSRHLLGMALDITFGLKPFKDERDSAGRPLPYSDALKRAEMASRHFANHNFTWKGAKDIVHFDWNGQSGDNQAEIDKLNKDEAFTMAKSGPSGKPEAVCVSEDSAEQQAALEKEHDALNTRGLYDPEGLDTTPWFKDEDLVVGNKHLVGSPVSFSINLQEFDMNRPLPNKAGGTTPLTLLLNCSLNDIKLSMKHITNKANSRTGFHLTFWGMSPDTITGSGTTGAFMNQFGLTDIMSLVGIPTDLGEYQMESRETLKVGYTRESDFRIAAQDAFVELLSLFRNNGFTRYRADNYDPTDQTVGRDQVGQSVWSEKYGDSNFTRNARNNDVMAKGNVVMRYKNNTYHGYFKSLSWNMDAENPFQWKFDFTFQVQRSVSFVYYPE